MAQDDREALRLIFRATNGPDGWFNTEGWNTNAELGDWFGVQVNASKSRVVGLHLGDTYHRRDIYHRDGWIHLAMEFAKLTFLEGRQAPSEGSEKWRELKKQMRNSFPRIRGLEQKERAALDYLDELLHLSFDKKRMSFITRQGPKLSQPEIMIAFKKLGFSFNNLTGPIPSRLKNLDGLKELHLRGNNLTGPIPSWLEELNGLKELDVSFNALTGSIPSELGKLSALQSLDLGHNQLSGSIPSELGKLSALQSL
ncbi:unnamed protein product, partial [Ascophyllum nodosum]